ncbi:MAG TPA: ABC transporter permease, partial [Gammaproteobacteria bacterium]|nr:ABC transporter permease [Gammaproteobacteria bacterium]
MIPHKSVYLASSRHIQRHPWLLVLSFIGIALGVAVVVAIDLANTSALRAFEQADQTLTGKTTHRIVGGPGGVDEKYYVALRLKLGLTRVTPVIEGYGVAQDMPGYAFKLLGVDSFSDAPFRNFTNWQEKAANETAKNQFTRLITEPASVLISRHRADVLGLKLEDQLRILLGEQVKVLRLIGYIPVADERSVQAMDNLLLMDIATAQEVLDFQQRLSRIDLIIPDQPGRKALLEEIAQLLPPGAQIISSKTRSKALSQMT